MNVDIRPATPGDVGALQRVAGRAWHTAHAPIIGEDTVEEFLDDHYDEDSFRSRIEDREAIFDVAEDTDSPVGFVLASPNEEDATTFVLGQIYVHPDRWGEGIGRRLLSHTEREIEHRGGSRVRLGVMAENERAVSFYEEAGYTRAEEFYDERIETSRSTLVKELPSKRFG